MIDIEALKLEIIKHLEPLNLDRVILFGSYAYGTPNIYSDIDLYVVTKDEYIPKNWEENRELTRNISRSLRDLRSKFPMDLVVHTKEMNRDFIKLDSYFSREIFTKGILLL